MPVPKRVAELAAQILIDTGMGANRQSPIANRLSPAVVRRLKRLVDTA